MMMKKCPYCKKGVMYPRDARVHVVDNMMVRGNVLRCGRCGEVAIETDVYVKIDVLTEKPDERGAGVGL